MVNDYRTLHRGQGESKFNGTYQTGRQDCRGGAQLRGIQAREHAPFTPVRGQEGMALPLKVGAGEEAKPLAELEPVGGSSLPG